ncbi:MAG: hypothetical protein L6Q34_02420 [Nitrospira sp.]|nr:MAG: Alpha/beta hydrolase family protein [Nitrospira sp. OLB3]MCE7966555.1 hypothetical protein [Nitrospira sp. NTP2]MCK6492264.1 hypothetical protein [Nitrospira sp.]MEB2339107.1 hypothetical protein [Nitrospirales bacterium]QOJ35954.1 MAG: hypothetical protein HRU82_13805 [Nitrospira sp.]
MLNLRKANQNVLSIASNGDVTFSNIYREVVTNPPLAGELQIRKGAAMQASSKQSGAVRNVELRGRLFDNAVFPGQGLQLRDATGVQAEFDVAGDLYVRGRVTNALTNPATPGPFAVISVVYAAAGLSYGAGLAQYAVFQTPSPGYATRRIDISDFANLPASPTWPFNATNVPINGLLRIPQGPGPFPLVLFVHGNHSPTENSTPGYVYLMDLLASHGMIAGSVDCNFLNGWNFGENDGRAIVHLEHVKQFRIWNQQAGHPLAGKVDLAHVMIAGHSRGGEGTGHASAFNELTSVVPDPGDPAVPLDGSRGLGPYQFSLKAVVAIAPTENQYQPVAGRVVVKDNYFIVHGSRDGDVSDFQGYQTYDRAQPIHLANPTQVARGFKSLLWVYGANHNHFNSVWGQDDGPTISRADQENVAKVYFSALAQGALLHRGQYLNVLKDVGMAQRSGWIPASMTLVSQYQDHQRIFMAHYEEDANASTPSPPVNGTINSSGVTVSELLFNQGSGGNLYQQTKGLRVDWSSSTGRYELNIHAGGLPGSKLHILALRSGQSDDAKNQANAFQDFSIVVSDGTHSHTVRAAQFQPFPYPAQLAGGMRRSVMQTVRVPLRVFADAGVNIRQIRQIAFRFDQPISGTAVIQGSMYFDEVQLTH